MVAWPNSERCHEGIRAERMSLEQRGDGGVDVFGHECSRGCLTLNM
jgi:hypothetical protein